MTAVQRAERVYRHSTRVFGVVMVVLGAAMVAGSLVRGGGPLSYGVVLGVLFAALGAARLYLARSPREPR
jgi:hypothetical protein